MNQTSAETVILMDLAERKGVLMDIDGRSIRILKPLGEDVIEVAHVRRISGKSDAWQLGIVKVVLETL